MKRHKFSIIVPVYNVENYIEKCINSILNQTYKNYEVIVINDGSTDNCANILENYKENKKIKIITQKNQGLSGARNEGLKHITGDYILFIDSDDYIQKDLLETLNNNIKDEDLIRFQAQTVNEDYEILKKYEENEFKNLSGIEAFNNIVKYRFIEPACFYAYKKDFFIKEKFKFKENTYHEDFGLIPLIILKSKKVLSLNYIGYNYLIRNNSITSNIDYKKEVKKAYDVLEHYKFLKKETSKIEDNLSIFKSFISNSVILKLNSLKGKEYKKYLKELKQEKVFDNILSDTLSRKIKKIILKINPKIYFKMR